MYRKPHTIIPRYTLEKAYAFFENVGLDINEYNKRVDNAIKKDLNQGANDYEIIYATTNFAFCELEEKELISFPDIPLTIKSPLSLETRYDIQKHLKKYISKELTPKFNSYRASHYSPFNTIYQMYCDEQFRNPINHFMEKVYYAYSFLNTRNISNEQKIILDYIYNFIIENSIYLQEIEKFGNTHKLPNFYISEEYLYLLNIMDKNIEDAFAKATQNYNNTGNYYTLYNTILDITLNELTYYCIGKLYVECNTNTSTYKELIEKHLFNHEHVTFPEHIETAIYKKEEDSFRTHIKNFIFPKDEEETYYRKFRGNSKNKNKTFSLCEQDIYNLIYIFYERRSPRQNKMDSLEFTKENLKDYYDGIYKDFLEDYGIDETQKWNLSKFSKCYKLYLDYIVLHKETKITGSLIKDCDNIHKFHNIIEKALMQKDNSWYNMTSLFISPWDFIQTAACVYSRRILPEVHRQTGTYTIDLRKQFIKYCYELDQINLPETKLKLLTDKRFFDAYIEYPYWVQDLLNMLKGEYHVVINTLSRFLNLKTTAFNNSEKELETLINILSSYNYHKPEYIVSDLELETFLTDFLPSKKKK